MAFLCIHNPTALMWKWQRANRREREKKNSVAQSRMSRISVGYSQYVLDLQLWHFKVVQNEWQHLVTGEQRKKMCFKVAKSHMN